MNGCYIKQDNAGERYVIYLIVNIIMTKDNVILILIAILFML